MTPAASDERVDALAQMTFTVTPLLARVAAAFDLSLSQFRLLGILRDRRPRVVELAGALGLDKSSVSGLIDRAETRGFVRRVRDDADRRVVRVELTDDGRRLVARGESRITEDIQPLLSAIPLAEQRVLARGIRSLLDAQPHIENER